MNKNIWKFIEIVGFDKLRLSIYNFCILLSTFLELSLFYKLGTISEVTLKDFGDVSTASDFNSTAIAHLRVND